MFEITTKWLEIHSTKKGGWTRKQAEILGFTWPLKKGWKRKIHGQFITNTDRVNFESAANITCKTKSQFFTIKELRVENTKLEKENERLKFLVTNARHILMEKKLITFEEIKNWQV